MENGILKGEDIVYFGNDWNADNKTSSHHIAERLSLNNRLLYVECPGLRRPTSSSRDIKRIWQKFTKWMRGPVEIHNNLHVLSLFLLPFHGKPGIRKINEFLISQTIIRGCNNLGFQKPILWVLAPHIAPVLNKVKGKMIVHWCTDKHSEMPGVERDPIAAMENDLINKSDVIFTVNKQLYSQIKPINANTYFTQHGVDISHFGKALDSELPIPEDMKKIPHPIIGFFGLIEEWIDQDLFVYMAKLRPSWSFVLIGRAATDISRISAIPNIHLLGSHSYSKMPLYAKCFDVAIIPFIINELTLDSNPLKLREYLAAGLPVVSTPLPEVRKYEPIVYIAEKYDEFLEKTELALNTNSQALIQERLSIVAQDSWDARVDEISRIVKSHLQKLI